jgi:hypothetical protein
MKFLLPILVTLVWLSTPQVSAQMSSPAAMSGCNCPGGRTLDIMEMRIAERTAKLAALANGHTESISGYSNDPVVLRGEIAEMSALRDRFVRQHNACLLRCHAPQSPSPDGRTMISVPVEPACETCNVHWRALVDAEANLAASRARVAGFENQHDVAALRADRARGSTADDLEFEQRQVALAEAEETYYALATAAERVCEAYENRFARPETDGSNANETPLFDAAGNPIDERWETASADERERILERANAVARWRRAVRRTEDILSLPGDIFDHYFEYLEYVDLYVLLTSNVWSQPSSLVLTDYGRCEAARATSDYYRENTLETARQSLARAQANVPGESRELLSEYFELTERFRRDGERRVRALEALIACNTGQCRPRTDPSGLFEWGGLYYEADTDDWPEDDAATEAVDVAGNAPDLVTESAPEPDPLPQPDARDGNRDEDVAGNAPDIGLTDETPEVVIPGLQSIPMPATPAPQRAPEPRSIFSSPLVSPYNRQPREACAISVEAICSNVRPSAGETCASKLRDWGARCEVWRVMPREALSQPPMCHFGCDLQYATVDTNNWLQSEVGPALRERYEAHQAGLRARRETTQASRDAVQARITEIEALRLHIYRHTDTGRVFEHGGDYFEPNPPLEYLGESRGLTGRQQALLDRLRQQLVTLNFSLQLQGEPEDLRRWYERSLQMLNGGGGFRDPTMCSNAEAIADRDQCYATCDETAALSGGQSAGMSGQCQPNWVMDLLSVEDWTFIEPPGAGAPD